MVALKLSLDGNIMPIYRAVYRESYAHTNNTFIFRESSIRYANFYDIESVNQCPEKYPTQTKMTDMSSEGIITILNYSLI